MLLSIDIANFALIEHLNLDFQSGMTVITGETGAGKSIVIDALSLALGERADATVIRFGCEKADISACFRIKPDSTAFRWLLSQEFDPTDDCILRRVVAKEGRSRCFINGQTVTLNTLKELADSLVDIHGQHAHQSLLKSAHQLSLLDALLDDQSAVKTVRNLALEYKSTFNELTRLQNDQQQRKERAELLAYQLNELEALGLSKDSIEQLEVEHSKVSHLQDLTAVTQSAQEALFDEEPGVYGSLIYYQEQFRQLTKKDTALVPVYEQLLSATSILEETRSELRHYLDSLDVDPSHLGELEERLSTLFELSRKHHGTIQELPEIESKIRLELELLQGQESDTQILESKTEKLRNDYRVSAEILTGQRQFTAQKLSKEISKQMSRLGMQGGKFNIQLNINRDRFSKHGQEEVEFLVTANPGQPLQPLHKVASGGELSRISLAIQMITAQKRVTPCLIFDEVDVGIGGQTADSVGRMLATIAEHTQVICVTHQPQVAARGSHHLQASKTRLNDATHTAIKTLKSQQRIEEIARMVGGYDITELSLKHAEELLTQ